MNKSGIEWCDHTWNPVTGCLHKCRYCYARQMVKRFCGDVRLNKMAKDEYSTLVHNGTKIYVLEEQMRNETGSGLIYPFGFEPTYHKYRLDFPERLKMGNNIFVGAMTDLFGDWVPDSIIQEIMDVCKQHPEHNYLFLTKNPSKYLTCGISLDENMWYGTTITKPADIMERMLSMTMDGHTFVSIEPLHAAFEKSDLKLICELSEWIIIGAETGRRKGKVVPKFDWIKDIVKEADSHGVPVFMKESLVPIVGEDNMRREFPSELTKKSISRKMENKLYDVCNSCGSVIKKSEMIALSARSARGEASKQFCFMCKKCFKGFCNDRGIEIPKLVNLEE